MRINVNITLIYVSICVQIQLFTFSAHGVFKGLNRATKWCTPKKYIFRNLLCMLVNAGGENEIRKFGLSSLSQLQILQYICIYICTAVHIVNEPWCMLILAVLRHQKSIPRPQISGFWCFERQNRTIVDITVHLGIFVPRYKQ